MNCVKGEYKMKRKYSFGILIFLLIAVYGIGAYAFSDIYEPYYPQITAVTRSVDEIYQRVSGSEVELSPEIIQARKDMIQMYKDVGIDVSYDMENWLCSYKMVSSFPQRWSDETPIPLGESPDYSGAFSVDACWNNKIPKDAPRIEIPRSSLTINDKVHIGVVKANIDQSGWGTGIPQIVSTSKDPYHTIASKYVNGNVNKIFMVRAKENLFDYVNNAQTGDEHIQFIDAESNTSVQVWKGRVPGDPRGYSLSVNRIPGFDVRSSAAGIEYKLDGIGAEGQCGVNAANCITNAYTIKSSEISSTTEMLNHAVGGAIAEMITARVFPAISTDAALGMSSENEGSNSFRNTGIVPYGGIIQVDPEIDLDALYKNGKMSFHSYRILKCMQEYGFYNIDCSGGSFFFYTNTYGNDWINPDFRGFDVPIADNKQGFSFVIDELNAFFKGDSFFGLKDEPKLYLTTPVVKYADIDVNDDGVIDVLDHDLIIQNVYTEYNDSTKQYDVNQDKEITPEDIEILNYYLNDMPIHTFTWHDVSYADNDTEHGRIVVSGPSNTEGGITRYKDGMMVSFGVVAENGWEFAGWTGDFAKYGTQPVVKMEMDKSVVIGAKYKKTAQNNFVVKVAGPGHVEVSETGIEYDAPKKTYGINTLLSIKAVPDEGYTFLGWAGDISGYSNPTVVIVKEDTEIIAMFGEAGYSEKFIPEEWSLESGTESAYKVTEGAKISFSDFSQGNQIVVNTNKNIDLSSDFVFRAKLSNNTSIGDGNMGKMVFNYKDIKNHYYITLGGEGKVVLNKLYKGIESKLGEFKGSLDVNGVLFSKLPITLEVERNGSYLYIRGYKDGETIEYLKVRDKTLKGGTFGFGTKWNGIFSASDVVVQNEPARSNDAAIQKWSPSGDNGPWVEKLREAVVVAADNVNAYVKGDYTKVSDDGAIKPYYAADKETIYVPLRYVTEKLGGKVAYDPATDSVISTYGEHSGTFKAWTNGAQEVNGTLYVPAKALADALGKELYQYKAVAFFSDTQNIYNPDSEPECQEFIRKAFDINYYM